MAKRSDEEQALAGTLGLRLEAVEIDAVLDHTARSPTVAASFFDITTMLLYLRHGARLEAAPAEPIPPGGKGALAAEDLREEVVGNVVLN